MIAAGRSCLDLAQQLHAVEKAISQARKTLIQDHLDLCLDASIEAPSRLHLRSGGSRSNSLRLSPNICDAMPSFANLIQQGSERDFSRCAARAGGLTGDATSPAAAGEPK